MGGQWGTKTKRRTLLRKRGKRGGEYALGLKLELSRKKNLKWGKRDICWQVAERAQGRGGKIKTLAG